MKKNRTIQNPFENRIFDASILLEWVTSPYKIAILSECKHSQKAILHGSE